MLRRSLNRILYLSLRNNNVTRSSSVRLFTATSKTTEVLLSDNTDNSSKLATEIVTEIVSSNSTDTSSNLSFLKTDSIKVEDTETFHIKFKENMNNFSRRRNWNSMLDLCEKVKKSNIKPDLFIYNTILYSYIPLGSFKHSFKLLNDMKLANVKPNLITYHHLLRTCIQAHHSEQDPNLREQIIEMITKDGLQPDLRTYEIYIESLLVGEEYERAFEVFDSLKSKNIYPRLEFYIAMIRKAISINESGIALNYLKELEQNPLVYIPNSLYNDVLRFCAYEYNVDGVLHCWNKLQHRGLDLDEGTCVDILYFAGRHGKPDLIIPILEYLMNVRKLKLHKFHFVPLIQAYINIGDIKNAMESLGIFRDVGFQPGLVEANEIFSAIRKDVETIDKAYYCLEEIHNEGKKVDVSALNVIIAACSNIGEKRPKRKIDIVRAMETYKAAEKLDVKPNAETFNTLLLVCLYAKQKDVADQLWKEMLELKISPSSITYYRMIQVICTQENYEEAFVYLENMKSKNLLPSREIYEKIIKKCVHNGDTRALLALEEMKKFKYVITPSLYDDLKAAGFDINLFNESRKNSKIRNNNNSIETGMPVKDAVVMDEFVDMIASLEINENEQKIS